MKLALFATLPLVLASVVLAAAQNTTPAQPKAPQAKPAAPRPRPPAATSAAPQTATVTVTDQSGAPIADVHVRLTGSLDRSGSTQSNGVVRFDSLRPGTYRLRFEKEGYVLFERELEVRAGQPAPNPAVTLTTAPAPPPPPPAPPAPEPQKTAALPPPGKPTTVNVPDFIERNFITNNQPQKVSGVSCSGLANTVLWQIREPWQNRQHENADTMLYVVGGEGTIRMDGRETPLQAGSFAQVPRGTEYSLTRRGRNPVLIVLATLAGEPCQ
jgi:mannose-6-phosphate isomerase-like protein (cupin superfamily)